MSPFAANVYVAMFTATHAVLWLNVGLLILGFGPDFAHQHLRRQQAGVAAFVSVLLIWWGSPSGGIIESPIVWGLIAFTLYRRSQKEAK